MLILVSLLSAVLATPVLINPPRRTECEPADEVLCQTCAKLTKSRFAYPMCCENKEDVRRWCSEYVNFGLHLPNQKLHAA